VRTTPGAALVAAFQEQYPFDLPSGRWTSGRIDLDVVDGLKANELSESASAIVVPDYQTTVQQLPSQPPTVASLLAPGVTNRGSVNVLQESTFTNVADTVAEMGDKPQSVLQLERVSEPVRKIATFLPVSDEMLEDGPGMQSYIDTRLASMVEQTLDDQLLNGDGSTPNLVGLLHRAGIQESTALALDTDSVIDAVNKAIAAIRDTAYAEPDGIVLNHTDWSAIRLMKDNQKNYYGDGPFGNNNSTLWGLPVVATSRIAAGSILIGAFRTQCQLFRRGSLVVEMTNSHSDYFTKNLIAVRAELRAALAVYRSSAFYLVTGANLLEGS
jgi:HK97 family phage major capsid protein